MQQIHGECPKCGGCMTVSFNPKIPVEKDEHCFRCGYFHTVEVVRRKPVLKRLFLRKNWREMPTFSIRKGIMTG